MFGIPLLPAAFTFGRVFLQRRGAVLKRTIINGQRVSYFELQGRGTGPQMLLVHGLAGSSLSWGRCMVALAARSSRLIALDLPGAGISPEPVTGPLRYAAFVELVEQFAQQIMPGALVLAGASMGAAIAARVAPRLGERVKALVLVVPAGAQVSEQHVPEQLARLTVQSEADARALVSRLFARRSRLREWACADDVLRLYNRPWVQTIVKEGERDTSLMVLREDELASLALPTALYWAKEEHLLMEDGLAYFRQHLPAHAEIEVLDGVGHCALLEEPERIASKITAFLAGRGV